MNSRGILKFDLLRIIPLSGGGFHYDQESSGGEFCTWMKNDMVVNVVIFFEGGSFLGNLKASDKKLDLQRTPT